MVSTTYRTGSWLGIVRNGSVIVLEGQTDPAIVHHLWDFLGRQPTIHGVLNEVTEKFGTGLTGLPDFAIVVQSDRLHAILRGDITLLARTGDAEDMVSGRDVTTWSERSLSLPETFVLTLAEPEAGESLLLPVGEAVVPLQLLSMDIEVPAGPSTHDGGQLASATIAPAAAPTAGNGDFAHDGISLHQGEGRETAIFAPADSRLDGDQTAGVQVGADRADAKEPAGQDLTGQDFAEQDLAGQDLAEQDLAEQDLADAKEPAGQNLAGQDFAGQQPGEEADDEEYAGFAMAAAAADAEWNAQLAPVGVSAGAETDLNLTIRPENADDEQADDEEQPVAADPVDLDPDNPESAEAAPEGLAVDGVAAEDLERDEAELHAREQDEQGQAEQPAHPAPHVSEAALETAEEGFTTNYDYLFGATIAKSVEDAAVRLDEDGQPVQPSADPVMPPLPPLPPVAGNSAGHPQDSGAPAAQDTAQHPEQPVGEQAVAAHGDGWEPAGLLIDSVPWGKTAAAAVPAPASADALESPASVSAPPANGSFAPTNERSSESNDPDHFEPAHFDPDHDGNTLMRSDVTDPQSQAAEEPLESRPPTGPMVLARMCPHGHANPPSRSQCSDCGASINSEPREVGRPRLGSMHISSGEVVELDHSLVIGRQPSVSRVMGGAMPRLVQVKSGNDDISRSHVEVRLDGWDVLLVDLKATNGTVLVREGQAPRRLSQGEEAILLNGDIAELGDGVSLLFDGLL
ncbi:FHA domain-containing protein [Arthrobacter sp. H35-D1]|uniref:FHA domain-containing protein n=1 Tax=Arthrobacter sp. H35-D1 TaxID=3046202 RepID=UPI0024B8C8B5|nr:FHA domain-containing protein [Arthrobacter sp. H35-D1]MDJ0314382.1 FHA domain-containing protein [Arthrobacter sp. H35-D1]